MRKLLWCFLLLAVASCKEKYLPNINDASANLLVVDGVINAGAGPTTFRLSRTLKMVDTTMFKAETRATVTVQGKDNSSHPLPEKGNGYYTADQLTLNPAQQYRLHIRTAGGKEYASDYVEVRQTPAIDSVSWERNNRGVQVYVNTHDPANNTRYYRWDYEETWEYHSTVVPQYDFRNLRVIEIDPQAENLFTCWKTFSSTNIFINSTAALIKDEVQQQPLILIPNNAEQLSVRYSVLVKQYALTADAYNFLKIMKRNTEDIGSVFGPLPVEISGNIRNVSDPGEAVIGFVSASTVRQSRIFIRSNQVPGWDFQLGCNTRLVDNNPDSIEFYFPFYRPYDAVKSPSGAILQYIGITPECADCRLRKGVNVKPSFW